LNFIVVDLDGDKLASNYISINLRFTHVADSFFCFRAIFKFDVGIAFVSFQFIIHSELNTFYLAIITKDLEEMVLVDIFGEVFNHNHNGLGWLNDCCLFFVLFLLGDGAIAVAFGVLRGGRAV